MNAKGIFMIITCCLVLLSSCSNDDSDPQPQNSVSVEELIIVGAWRVNLYQDGQDNETSSFNNIELEFSANNEFLIFRNGEELLTGTWALLNRGQELDVVVPALANENDAFGEDLYEISDDWDITFSTETELHLVDDEERFELLRIL